MIRNSQPMVSVPVDTLQELRACIIGFEEAKRCDLMPTTKSLQVARDLIRVALDAPRSFAPIAE